MHTTVLLLSLCTPPRLSFFFFNDTATTEIYTLSLHDALPISAPGEAAKEIVVGVGMGIDQAGQDEEPARIEHLGRDGLAEPRRHRRDALTLDEHVRVLQPRLAATQDPSPADQEGHGD